MSGSIGPHNFLLLRGNVPIRRTELEVIAKPGEDGHLLRRIGDRSQIFELESHGIYLSKGYAGNAFEVFGDMIDLPPQTFGKDGVIYSAGSSWRSRPCRRIRETAGRQA